MSILMNVIGYGRMVTIATLIICLYDASAEHAEFTGPATDRDLEAIFKGRCAEFIAGKINPHITAAQLRTKNCTHLWELFYDAFSYRDPCNVTMDRYSALVNEATVDIPADRAVYWDGFDVYALVRSYANEGNRAIPLEYTLIGYLVNQLVFCGQTDDPGVNYHACPSEGECDGFASSSVDSFWGTASVYFGKHGKGNVGFIVNSNRPGGAFHVENSFFTAFELSNMDPADVTRIDIYIVTFIGEKPGETCESASIQTLKSIINDKGIEYTCTDQPDDILHVMCADQPTAEECQFAQSSSGLGPRLLPIALGALLLPIVGV